MTSECRHHLVWLQHPPRAYASLSDNPVKDVAVIFVHGFGGESVGTWLLFQLLSDSLPDAFPEWKRCDLFFYDYDSTNIETLLQVHADRLLEFVRTIFPKPAGDLIKGPAPEIRKIVRQRWASLDSHGSTAS
jgi:hypothetical protein